MTPIEKTISATVRRLLVVDDELAVLKFVKAILSRAHYESVTCDNVEEALTLLQRQSFDCVITDAGMPGIDGYELVKLIRKDAHKDLPILMLTKKRHRQDVKKAVEAGITDYVLKPIDEHLLLDKVEGCLKNSKLAGSEPFISEDESIAQLQFNCKISLISDTHLMLKTPFMIPFDSQFELNAPLFEQIGIHPPTVKLISCNAPPVSLESKPNPYEAKFSLIGVTDSDLQKIRNWINQGEPQSKK